MKREVLANGKIRLTSANGIVDTRNGDKFSVVECKASQEVFFKDA